MRTASYLTLAALGTALCVAGALTSSDRAPAQAPPPNLPASTVYGRLGISAGPGQAIPFGTLLANLFPTTGVAGQLFIDQGLGNSPSFNPMSGDCTITAGGVISCTKNPVFTGLTVNPTPGTLNTAINSTQTLAGTTAVPFAANLFAINTDVTNAGANFVLGWDFGMLYGGGAMQGGRQTLSGYGTLTAPSNASSPLRSYVGVTGAVTAQSADNGTSPGANATAKGALYGGNFSGTAQNGATALHNVTGAEFNTAMQTGSSVFAKTLAQFSSNTTDAVSGSVVDSMLWLYAQTGSTAKWGNGIRWDDAAGTGVWPFNSSSTIIQTGGSGTANTGIDFSNTTFTTSAFKSNGFNVDGNGNITQAGGAWTTYTPSPTCGTATFTVNSARRKTVDKTTNVELDITITAIGTCTSPISFTLPNTSNSAGGLAGREIVTSGQLVGCSIATASATPQCVRADQAAFVVNQRVVLSGVYENQ